MGDINQFSGQKVLVVGDLMLDQYILGQVHRISPEAPVPVVKKEEEEQKLGGAGNVVLNLLSLGAKVRVVGRIGADEEGTAIEDLLKENSVDVGFLERSGKTTVKTRISAKSQQFLRIDQEEIVACSEDYLSFIKKHIEPIFQGVTAVLFSDYNKGFLSETLTRIFVEEGKKRNLLMIADPKGTSVKKYGGITAITPNNKEFLDLTGLSEIPEESEVLKECVKLRRDHEMDAIVFTRSEKGISLVGGSGEIQHFPAIEQEVVDVTGAGDTVIAVLTLCKVSGFSWEESLEMCNYAASKVIAKFGAAQVRPEDLRGWHGETALSTGDSFSQEETLQEIATLKASGKKIVFTNGCFDLVHAGHLSSFKQAKAMGDVLVVGLNSDESIRRIKGEARPIVSLEHRKALLMGLSVVDFVLTFEEDTPENLIRAVCPDVLVKGKDWEGQEIAGGAFVQSQGGVVAFIDLEQGLSTTHIIEKILKGQQIEELAKRRAKEFAYFSDYVEQRKSRLSKGKEDSSAVLLLRLDNIGDCTMFTASALALREYYKDRPFHVACAMQCQDVFRRLGVFDKVIPLELAMNPIREPQLELAVETLREESYDIVLQPQISRFPVADILVASCYSNRCFAIEGKAGNSPQAWIDRTASFYDHLFSYPRGVVSEFTYHATFVSGVMGKAYKSQVPTLPYEPQTFLEEPYYVVYAGSAMTGKLWPSERFAQLISYCYEKTGLKAVLLGVQSEQWIANQVKRHLKMEDVSSLVVDLVGRTSVSEVIDLIGNAQFILSNDTSGVHIACATKTPSVAVVGVWHLHRFLPYHIDEVRDGDVLPVAVWEDIDCGGCDWNIPKILEVNPHCRQCMIARKPYPCISKISLEKVKGKVEEVIRGLAL